jgi:hypothetical protein
MKRIPSISLSFLIAISFISLGSMANSAFAQTVQEQLNNQSIVEMVKSGLSTEIIIAKIKSAKSDFDTSSKALQDLKKEGVADSIVLVMVKKASGIADEPPTVTSSAPETTANVVLPDGTEVKLITIEEISSKKAIQDDLLTFKIAEDVKIGNKVVIAKGAIAKGIVTNAKKKGMMGRSGELNIRIESTETVDGQTIKLRSTKSGEGGDKVGTTVALTVLFGPLGLLKRGKDAVIKADTILTDFTNEAKTIVVKN